MHCFFHVHKECWRHHPMLKLCFSFHVFSVNANSFILISVRNKSINMSMLFSEDCLFVHLVFFMVWLRFMVVVVFGFLGALRERERGKKGKTSNWHGKCIKKSIEKTVNGRNSYKYFRFQREDLILYIPDEISMYIQSKRSNVFWITGKRDILNTILWQTSHWVVTPNWSGVYDRNSEHLN